MTDFGLYGGFPADPGAPERDLQGYLRGMRKSQIPGASDIWGIGRANLPEGIVPITYTWAEIERDTAWAALMLEEMGVGADSFCFFSTVVSLAGQFWPWHSAVFHSGGRFANGMPTSWDAYRLEMYLRLFNLKLVFALTSDVLDGIEAMKKSLSDVFGKAEIITALPGAHERLTAAGFKPWRVSWLGPIFALDPCDGTGGRFDNAQWTLESDNGQILISSKEGRTTPFVRTPTGVRGEMRSVGGEPRLFVA